MRLAIFGAGGVGGYFGARLAQAGHEVTFIARGQHLAAMQRDGLRIVNSAFGDIHLNPTHATDDPADIGPVDIVLFCVKLYDSVSAAARLPPLIGAETAVITLQNGIDGRDHVAAAVGAEHAVGGVAYISAAIEGPGVVAHLNRHHRLLFGETDGRSSPRLERFAAAGRAAGFVSEVATDIDRAIWEKFVFLSAMAGLTGLTRLGIGAILRDAETRELLRRAIAEAVAVARAKGVALAAEAVDQALSFAESLPPGMKASLLFDLEKGRPIEVEGLSGAVARLGRSHGVPTPIQQTIYALLKPHADGKPQG
jgi:2-dehydropantoate 2-reductase